MSTMRTPSFRTFGLTLVLSLTAGTLAFAGQADDLAPEGDEAGVAVAILGALEQVHYEDVVIDDAFSEGLLHSYLDTLDPSRSAFLASDVDEFERRFGLGLDDALLGGDLKPAFEIFNRFHDRVVGQLEFFVQAVGGLEVLAFDVPESVVIDRSKDAWPETEADARELWRKRFKNEVLVMRLNDRSNDEIRTALERRFENQLRRFEQTRSRDVFSLFMNTVTGAFDPHTSYFPPRDAENFDMQMSLSFQGIGAQLSADGEFTKIVRLIPGGPAEESGQVHAADRILAVGQGTDGEMVDVVGWRVDDIVELIRGPKDTAVRLALRSGDAVDGQQVVTLTRARVKLEEQAAKAERIEVERDDRNWNIGVIDLPTFYADFEAARAGAENYKSSTRDVYKLLEELTSEGVDGIVVDLRGNSGGSLDEARTLSSLFLGRGPVVQIRNEEGRVQVLGSKQRAVYDGPLVVLVDRLSASASEIFAAAIQDRGRGLVLGSDTFGKGTVQTFRSLATGQLKYTQAKFYRVNGGSTQVRGVVPDIAFPSVYDMEDVGEGALPAALPWDRIRALDATRPGFEHVLPELRAKHAKRVASDPALVRQAAELALYGEARKRTEISLVEAERRKQTNADEQRLLEIANAEREARGLESVADVDALREAETDDDRDVFLREAAEVLVDLAASTRVAAR